MSYFNEIMEKSLPPHSKSFMRISYGRIRSKTIEPDCIVAKINITTKDSGNTQAVRDTTFNAPKIQLPFKCSPSRTVMYASE